MSAIAPACVCGSIGAPQELRLCVEHHAYMFGDRKLPSVNQVIRAVWPFKTDWDAINPDVLEYARIRGIKVDGFFSEWINTGNVTIEYDEWMEMVNPSNGQSMRMEVIDRTQALCDWWADGRQAGEKSQAQVMMTDGEVAGTADIVSVTYDSNDDEMDKIVYDAKNTSALDPTYHLQVAAYMDMCGAVGGGLIHVTQAKGKAPKVALVPIDDRAIEDWRLTRDFYFMCQRRAK